MLDIPIIYARLLSRLLILLHYCTRGSTTRPLTKLKQTPCVSIWCPLYRFQLLLEHLNCIVLLFLVCCDHYYFFMLMHTCISMNLFLYSTLRKNFALSISQGALLRHMYTHICSTHIYHQIMIRIPSHLQLTIFFLLLTRCSLKIL